MKTLEIARDSLQVRCMCIEDCIDVLCWNFTALVEEIVSVKGQFGVVFR